VKFSIITPIKNDKKNILNTINSLKKQTFKNYQHIIVNGMSNDGSSEIINKHAPKKNFKHIIRKDKNLYQALNYGIKIAKGEYIGILHSGDVYKNNNILKIINKKIKNNDAISGNVIFKNKNKSVRLWNYKITKINKYNSFKVSHTSLFIKSKIAKKIKYNTKFKISSDTDFILKLASLNNLKFKYFDIIFIVMKYGGLSTSLTNFYKKIFEDLIIYMRNFGFFFIFMYFYKLIFKLIKLLGWKITK